MNEKKLTNKEIVKAWDICNNTPSCFSECPYFNKHGKNFCMENKTLYKDIKRIVQEHAEYERKFEDGELVSKEWHDEQVLHAENEIEELKNDYIELDLECRNLRTELDKELAEHEEFTKKANEEIERLTEENGQLKGYNSGLEYENAELQKQVDELKEKIMNLKSQLKNATARRIK